jgi:Zn-dependent peptidase ImmA (M78 family)
MMTDQRKSVLSNLAASIAQEFHLGYITDLEEVARSEGIQCYFDHYEDEFDGMLICDENNDFHVHINKDRGNDVHTKRGRFTLAHELAHYFIDEHRIPLSTGTAAPHGTLHDFEHRDEVEEEADYFAGCLLMPATAFRNIPKPKRFSFETILAVSDAFNTSILSTVLRFAEVGSHSIFAVISANNTVKWFAKSKDFPNWSFRFKVRGSLPPTTVAGEFFTKFNSRYTGVEDVEPDDWFYPAWPAKTQMHEQCYYSDSYGYVISLIWFD